MIWMALHSNKQKDIKIASVELMKARVKMLEIRAEFLESGETNPKRKKA